MPEEAWTVAATARGRERATVTGRVTLPWTRKLNPLWWFANADEPSAPDWYQPPAWVPAWLPWRVAIGWAVRNPLHNFTNFVIGIGDRNYIVTGPAPVLAVQLSDVGRTGWKWSVIALGGLRLPFASYSGARLVFYAGWRPGGDFGLKLKRA